MFRHLVMTPAGHKGSSACHCGYLFH